MTSDDDDDDMWKQQKAREFLRLYKLDVPWACRQTDMMLGQ